MARIQINGTRVREHKYRIWLNFHIVIVIMWYFVMWTGVLSIVSADEITRTRVLMGTYVSITIGDASNKKGRLADLAFQEIGRVQQLLSTYESNSEISRLNSVGQLSNSSIEIMDVISRALYFGSVSGGAFDITVKPLLDLYQRCHRLEKRHPSVYELATAKSLVDFRNVVVKDDSSIIFRTAGTQITADAIAKGYIIDRVIDVLRKNDVHSAFVDIGGDSRAIGEKSDGSPWYVALQDPRDPNHYLALIPLRDQAVATSGDYERYFMDDKKTHHIFDPRNGLPANSLISATITAKTAMDADALATTVFVLGSEEGMSLIHRLDGVEALVITENRTVLMSRGFETVSRLDDSPIGQD